MFGSDRIGSNLFSYPAWSGRNHLGLIKPGQHIPVCGYGSDHSAWLKSFFRVDKTGVPNGFVQIKLDSDGLGSRSCLDELGSTGPLYMFEFIRSSHYGHRSKFGLAHDTRVRNNVRNT